MNQKKREWSDYMQFKIKLNLLGLFLSYLGLSTAIQIFAKFLAFFNRMVIGLYNIMIMCFRYQNFILR